jgi:hypothetical protein
LFCSYQPSLLSVVFQIIDGLDFVVETMAKCCKELLEGSGGQVPLLRSMRELLRLLPDEQVRDLCREPGCSLQLCCV